MSDTHCKHGVLVDATNPDMADRCYACEPLSEDELRETARELDDWRRSAKQAWREIINLKRRLTSMRRGLRAFAEPNCLDGIDDYKRSATSDLKLDDDMRHRFQLAEKRRRS